MNNVTNKKATLTESEFCSLVGISRATALRQRTAGRLPHCRVGHRVLYLPKHVDEFLAACEQPQKDQEASISNNL